MLTLTLELDAASAAEQAAWLRVQRGVPGRAGHDPAAWSAWRDSIRTSNAIAAAVHRSATALTRLPAGGASRGDARTDLAELLDDALQDLLMKARAGDAHAFGQFYDRTASWLLPHVRRVCGNDDVERAIGEVYLQAWSTLQAYMPGDSPKGWLLRIAFANSRAAGRGGVRRPGMRSSQPREGSALVEDLAHDIRLSLSTAVEALHAMKLDRLPVDGATGQALARSLRLIERLVEAALQEVRDLSGALPEPHSTVQRNKR